MSPEHESSYYEIALTNRQVLTIFVVLLTCLVAAFLSGVWIGRRDRGEPLQASVGEPPAELAQSQMTELNFFSEEPERNGAKQAPPAVDPAPKPKPPSPAAEEKPAPEQRKEPAAEPPPPRPVPSQPAPASPTAAGRVIQVFSTLDATQADKLVRRLGAGGYPAFLVEESLGGKTTYRVRVGPYDQQARAEKVADELRREYRLETWITSQAG